MGTDTTDDASFVANAWKVIGEWTIHDDDDGHLFFYNFRTKESVWEAPEEIKQYEGEVMMKVMLRHALARSGPWSAHDAGNGTIYYFNEETRESSWERPSRWGTYTERKSDQERNPMAQPAHADRSRDRRERKKPPKTQPKKPNSPTKPKKGMIESEAASEHPSFYDDPANAKAISQFQDLLREKKIMPFCQWSVAFPRIANDPRFLAVPRMEDRRTIFDDFVQNRQHVLKVEQKERLKKAKKSLTEFLTQCKHEAWVQSSSTVFVFLTALEKRNEGDFKKIKEDALDFLSLADQEKIWKRVMKGTTKH